jgi:hypothetical protein
MTSRAPTPEKNLPSKPGVETPLAVQQHCTHNPLSTARNDQQKIWILHQHT